MAGDARQDLLNLLDRKAFDPVIGANPENYSEGDRGKLKDAQRTTESTKERYHNNYTTAEDVKTNFERDLHSDSAQHVQREIHSLGLPTLQDVAGEFKDLAEKHRVS